MLCLGMWKTGRVKINGNTIQITDHGSVPCLCWNPDSVSRWQQVMTIRAFNLCCSASCVSNLVARVGVPVVKYGARRIAEGKTGLC